MKNIYKALAQFQQEVPVIHEGTKGFGYTYASLKEILSVINPLLKKHGLGFTQLVDNNILTTVLFHSESGESIESKVVIKEGVELSKMNAYQVMGSAITYFRRYSLSAILGLVTDKDTDANGIMNVEEYSRVVRAFAIPRINDRSALENLYKMSKGLHNDKDFLEAMKEKGKELA